MLIGRRFLNILPLLSRSLGKSNARRLQTALKGFAKYLVPGGASLGYYKWSTDNTNKMLMRLAEEVEDDVSMCVYVLIRK